MKLGTKLISVCLALSLIPLGMLALLSYNTASGGFQDLSDTGEGALQESAFDLLDAARVLKEHEVESYFNERLGDVYILSEMMDSHIESLYGAKEAIGEVEAQQVEDYYQDKIKNVINLAETIDVKLGEATHASEIFSLERGKQIENYFSDMETMVSHSAASTTVIDAMTQYKSVANEDGGPANTTVGSQWYTVTETWGPRIDAITNNYGLSDSLLISIEGEILYTSSRNSDLGKNISDSALINEGVGEAWTEAKTRFLGFGAADYAVYSPAGAHVAFLAQMVRDYNGVAHGIFVIRLSASELNSIAQSRDGMASTQESYVVGRTGTNTYLRTARTVGTGAVGSSITGPEITKALEGETGVELRMGATSAEYELKAYHPLNISYFEWCIITSEIVGDAVNIEIDVGNYFEWYIDHFGFEDLYLIAPDGNIFYSAQRQADLGTNLITGPYSNTNLGVIFRECMADDEDEVGDIAYYPPAGKHVSFATNPVHYGGEIVAVVAVQIGVDRINNITRETHGLGEKGEAYLVSLDDNLMRSDSIQHTTSTLLRTRVDTYATQNAQRELRSAIYNNYRGVPVMGTFGRLDLGDDDINWAIVIEMDLEEALQPSTDGGQGNYLETYVDTYGYHDLFLIQPNGYIISTVQKEPDYHTNFMTGQYKDTHLADLFRVALTSNYAELSDFAYYAPAQQQSAFVASPVIIAGQVELVVALELNADQINRIMTDATGMGETGETYIVGADSIMRSDSRFSADGESDIGVTLVDTEAVREALAGRTGQGIITDYRGEQVLSSYSPLDVGSLHWAFIAEIDEAEAFAAANVMVETGDSATQSLLIMIVLIVAISAVIATIVSLVFTRAITRPVIQLSKVSKSLAVGDFNVTLDVEAANDEIGEMVEAYKGMLDNTAVPLKNLSEAAVLIASGDLTKDINITAKGQINDIVESFTQMQENLRVLVREIQDTSGYVAATSQELASSAEEMNASTEQVSSAIQQISKGSQTQASQVEDTANVMQQMSASVDDVTTRSQSASESASKTRESAETGRTSIQETVLKMQEIQRVVRDSAESISKLGKRSEEIGQIVDVITNITDQTNLLALNAAIEAARAGEQGRGFAVVAEEVKNLAEDSREAAARIALMIKDVQAETGTSVEAMSRGTKEVDEGMIAVQETDKTFQDIVSMAVRTADEVASISSATQQQKAGTERVAKSVDNIASIAEETASASEESAASTEELTASMEDMTARAQELSEMALALQRNASKFKIDAGSSTDVKHGKKMPAAPAPGKKMPVAPTPGKKAPVAPTPVNAKKPAENMKESQDDSPQEMKGDKNQIPKKVAAALNRRGINTDGTDE